MPIEELKQLMNQLIELTQEEVESKYTTFSRDNRFSVPKDIKEFSATLNLFPYNSQAEYLGIWFETHKSVLYPKQNYLRNLYEKYQNIAENTRITLMLTQDEFQKDHDLAFEYVNRVDVRVNEPHFHFLFSKNYPAVKGFGSYIVMASNVGIFSKGRKLSKKLELKKVSSDRAWKEVDVTSEEGRDKVIQDLREGFKFLCSSRKSIINRKPIITPEEPIIKVLYSNIPSRYLTSSGLINDFELYTTVQIRTAPTRFSTRKLNCIDFYHSSPVPTLFPYESETVRLMTSHFSDPVFLKAQSEILDYYGISANVK